MMVPGLFKIAVFKIIGMDQKMQQSEPKTLEISARVGDAGSGIFKIVLFKKIIIIRMDQKMQESEPKTLEIPARLVRVMLVPGCLKELSLK